MYKLHYDFSIVEKAKKWCLVDGKYTGSATLIAQIILSKYNSKEFPCVIDLQRLIGTLDETRLQLAFGVMLYRHDSIGEWDEMQRLKEMYLDS